MRFTIAVLAACHTAPVWRGDTGPARLTDRSDVLGGQPWSAYVAAVQTLPAFYVRLAAPLADASSSALYGVNIVTGDKNVSWMVDGDPDRGYWFVFDADANGDLANDERRAMTRDGDEWHVDIAPRPRHANHAALHERIVFDGRRVRVYSDVIREGTIQLDGRAVRFAITCEADCSEPDAVAIGFDLNGDGKVDLDYSSFERYRLSAPDRDIVVGDHTYTFEVARDGSSVSLRRVAANRIARPSLDIGTAAPDFELRVDGRRHKLSELRGRRVLLDFASIGCHFCVEDLQWLNATRARGIDVVTIATRDTTGELVDPQHATWVTIEPTDPGPIASLYRVEAYPAYFLIDRDGTLVCSRCKHAAIDAALATLTGGPAGPPRDR